MSAYKKSNSGYLPFIQKEKVTAPFTEINNRAKVEASLKCLFGVERVMVNSLRILPFETSDIGPVQEPDNRDTRIRFVGAWEGYNPITLGTYVRNVNTSPTDTTSFVEVTFYGTGLNVLFVGHLNRDYRVSIDGGSEFTYAFDESDMLLGRYSKNNTIRTIVSGLNLGWHTIKIRNGGGGSFGMDIFGFEFLNEASQITVKSGKSHGNGYEYELESDQLIDYNLGFDNVADLDIGTKGGRVIVYQDPADGSIKKRLNKVDATPQYLTNTNHSNEVSYRRAYIRGFGRSYTFDFNNLAFDTTADRAYTHDDGTTCLVGEDIRFSSTAGLDGGMFPSNVSDFFTLTFVGTGLDIVISGLNAVDGWEVRVNGTVVGNTAAAGTVTRKTQKICSGLPYGTHTVRFTRTGVTGNSTVINGVILYQPKKPSLPEGAIELADYNLLADYDNSNITINNDNSLYTTQISQGVIRKQNTREYKYEGSWTFSGFDSNCHSGFVPYTTTVGNYVEYGFFGTGVVLNMQSTGSGAVSVIVSIDGVNNDTGVVLNGNGSNDGGGAYSKPNLTNEKIEFTGLPLGWHTIRITQNSTANLYTSLDIITPVHTPHLTFGNRSLKDVRNFDSAKDINKTAKESETYLYGSYTGSNANIFSSKNVAQFQRISIGQGVIFFEEPLGEVASLNIFTTMGSGNSRGSVVGGISSNINANTYSQVGLRTRDENGNSLIDGGAVWMRILGKLQKDIIEEEEE